MVRVTDNDKDLDGAGGVEAVVDDGRTDDVVSPTGRADAATRATQLLLEARMDIGQ